MSSYGFRLRTRNEGVRETKGMMAYENKRNVLFLLVNNLFRCSTAKETFILISK